MLIEEMLRWRPVWAPEDEQGGGGDGTDTKDTDDGDDTGAGAGDDVKDDDSTDADTKTGDEDDGPGTILDGGTADGEDNPGEDDGKGDDADKDGEDDGDDQVPEAYDFSEVELPEGMEIDSEFAEAATPVLKELGLSQDKANVLAKFQAEFMAQQAEASIAEAKKIITGWVDTAKKDPEIGKAEWDESVRLGNSAIRQFGTPELVQDVMVQQGMGNHPEMIRFMARVGKHLASDTAPTGTETDGDPIPQEQAWYGETTPATKQR